MHWAGEMNSPGVLKNAGWLRPNKFGTPVGLLSRANMMAFAPVLTLKGQGQGKGKGKGKAAEPLATSVPHDPHDLNGVWRRSGGVLAMSNETPPMTPWGKARFDAAKPVWTSRGSRRVGQ